MAEVTADLVKKLRDATNVSMMECKRALVDADGDLDKAHKLLRERGIAVAAKKAARVTNQGLVAAGLANGGQTAALVEVNCETDFVARNPGFQAFVKEMADVATQTDTNLGDQIKDKVLAKIQEIGENIVVRRNVRFVLSGSGLIASYIHLGGKVGVLIEVGTTNAATADNADFRELVKDLTLHIAACSPKYLVASEVPAAEIVAERDIYAKQVKDKPAQIVEKIVDGKMKKFFADFCLVEQGFVKEPKQSVTDLLKEKGKQIGDTFTIRRFVRYQLGE
jgi:elongation factor Ts